MRQRPLDLLPLAARATERSARGERPPGERGGHRCHEHPGRPAHEQPGADRDAPRPRADAGRASGPGSVAGRPAGPTGPVRRPPATRTRRSATSRRRRPVGEPLDPPQAEADERRGRRHRRPSRPASPAGTTRGRTRLPSPSAARPPAGRRRAAPSSGPRPARSRRGGAYGDARAGRRRSARAPRRGRARSAGRPATPRPPSGGRPHRVSRLPAAASRRGRRPRAASPRPPGPAAATARRRRPGRRPAAAPPRGRRRAGRRPPARRPGRRRHACGAPAPGLGPTTPVVTGRDVGALAPPSGTRAATAMPASTAASHGAHHATDPSRVARAPAAGPRTTRSASKVAAVRSATCPDWSRSGHAELEDPAPTVATPAEVDDHVERGGELAVRRRARQAGGQRQRLDPGRDVGGGVGVERAAPPAVARVERRQQVDHLGPAHLPHHQPVGPHPQRLTHQHLQRDLAGALDVGRAALQGDDVGVVGSQLAGVLDQDDPLARVDERQERGEHRRLAGAGAAGDQEGAPRVDDLLQQERAVGWHRARGHQLGQGPHPTPRDPERQHRARPGHRRQHGVEARAVREAYVGVRRRVVQAPPGRGGQPLREAAHGGVVGERHRRALEPGARGRSRPRRGR